MWWDFFKGVDVPRPSKASLDSARGSQRGRAHPASARDPAGSRRVGRLERFGAGLSRRRDGHAFSRGLETKQVTSGHERTLCLTGTRDSSVVGWAQLLCVPDASLRLTRSSPDFVQGGEAAPPRPGAGVRQPPRALGLGRPLVFLSRRFPRGPSVGSALRGGI